MALLAYDGASAFDLNTAKQHGGIAVADYLVGHPGGYDPANEARVAHTRFLGMGAYPNWERTAGFFNTCTVAEAKAAGVEGAAATGALGFPADGTIRIAFSFDQYVPGARYAEMGQKFDAVRAGVGAGYQAAVYGQYGLINYLVAGGHAPGKHWLSGSTYNEPYNASGPNIAMVQSHDAQGNWLDTQVPGTDVNTVIDARALGAWWPPGSPYTTGAPDMDATQAKQLDALYNAMTYGGAVYPLAYAMKTQVEPMAHAVSQINAKVGALTNVDVAAFAAALAPLLNASGAVTQAMLEQALRTVLGSVDNPGVTP